MIATQRAVISRSKVMRYTRKMSFNLTQGHCLDEPGSRRSRSDGLYVIKHPNGGHASWNKVGELLVLTLELEHPTEPPHALGLYLCSGSPYPLLPSHYAGRFDSSGNEQPWHRPVGLFVTILRLVNQVTIHSNSDTTDRQDYITSTLSAKMNEWNSSKHAMWSALWSALWSV